jgi:hypothetical protein
MRGHKEKSKSPIKEPPLRQAGQSLREEREDILLNTTGTWAVLIGMCFLLASWEWCHYLSKWPPQPWTVTVFCAAITGFSIWRIIKARRRLRQDYLGMEGEMVVAQCLEELRGKGYVVIHDIPCDGWNIDHALIGPGGVFAIETKARRKPVGRPSEVVYDGETITVNGFPPERDPVIQVRAAARELKHIIKRTSGKDVSVQPVVLFVNWFINSTGPKDIWVLNESAFPQWVENEARVIEDQDVITIAEGIRMYVRNKADAS